MEQLVEVAHAIEQQHAGMLGLDAHILLHPGANLSRLVLTCPYLS
jgi:hypothetical protein